MRTTNRKLSKFVRASYILTIAAFMLQGCASPVITQLSGDTYQVKATDYRGAFGKPADFVADIKKQVDDFAAREGKVVQVVAMSEVPRGVLGRFYEFDYTFKLVSPAQPIETAAVIHPLDAPETPAQKRARLAAEKNTLDELARYDKQQQKAVQENAARIQKDGDGSPDDLMCKAYGFKPGNVPYAECRQKLEVQRKASVRQQQLQLQQQQVEAERQRIAQEEQIMRDREMRIIAEEASRARYQAEMARREAAAARQEDAQRRSQEQTDQWVRDQWNQNQRMMRDSWRRP